MLLFPYLFLGLLLSKLGRLDEQSWRLSRTMGESSVPLLGSQSHFEGNGIRLYLFPYLALLANFFLGFIHYLRK